MSDPIHPRGLPAGTADAAVDALAQAGRGWPEPPGTLLEREMPYWRAVMVARLPNAWHQIDLQHALLLARALADVEANRETLRREGDMIGKGNMRRVNPRHILVDQLTKRAIVLTRMLKLHGVPEAVDADRASGAKKEAGIAAETLAKTTAGGKRNPGQLLAQPRLQ